MRVLHVIPGLEMRDGGPSRAIRAMTAALQQRGVEVAIATTHLRSEGAACDADLSVPVASFPRELAPGWRYSLRLAQWLRHHIDSFDLLHLHSTFCYTTLAAASIARAWRRPYIIRPLGTLDAWSLQHHAWKKRPYYALIERRNLAHAAVLHATSESEASHLRRLRLPTRIAVVPLGFDLPPAPPARTLGSPLRLLFLSRLHPKKNIPVLLQAIALLLQQEFAVTLTIAGDDEGDYRGHLQQLTEQMRLASRVRFTGWVDGEQKQALFAQSHLFLLPSLQENFGIAVLEALAAGLPVILTPEVALSFEVTRAQAGLTTASHDPEALANAIRQLAQPEVYAAASLSAVRLARERFSLDAMTDELLKLYHSIL